MQTRRQFLKLTGAGTLGLFVATRSGWVQRALAQIPGGTLNPVSVPKFATPMLIPPVMPKAGTIKRAGGKNVDYYEISMTQFAQQILPAGLPATTVWGYGAVTAEKKNGLLLHNAPSLTIEAKHNTPVPVKWIDDLKDARRQLPTPPAAGRPDLALGQPARRHRRPRHEAGVRGNARPLHRAGCRSSPTSTVPWEWVTRATATPRPGTCQPAPIPERPRNELGPGVSLAPPETGMLPSEPTQHLGQVPALVQQSFALTELVQSCHDWWGARPQLRRERARRPEFRPRPRRLGPDRQQRRSANDFADRLDRSSALRRTGLRRRVRTGPCLPTGGG